MILNSIFNKKNGDNFKILYFEISYRAVIYYIHKTT